VSDPARRERRFDVGDSSHAMISPAPSDPAPSRLHRDVPCPFCGLACDDLDIEVAASGIRVVTNGCARSRRMFGASAPTDVPARVGGAPATLAEAIERAAAILRDATRPAFGGLATDVAGTRAALALAERLGGAVDHLGSRALMRNVRVLQDRGALPTTFAEVRNRADLIVVAGTDVVSRFPRFFERVAFGDAMFVRDRDREVVFVGPRAVHLPAAASPPRHLRCDNRALGEVFGALRALCAETMPPRADVGGIPVADLAQLAQRMQNARYGVLAWAAADLDFPHAELAIEAMVACVSALNERTRFSSLPLAGNEADVTANQVCLWQTGFPVRTSFAGGLVEHDADRYALDAQLAHDEVDALVWISSFDAALAPPSSRVPTIVLGRSGMRVAPAPAVQIDVATPGLDQAGHFFRGDAVVAVRLQRIAPTPLPGVADVLDRIAAAVG
jgi:formylmethanofuran dehydrogenase subunit B